MLSAFALPIVLARAPVAVVPGPNNTTTTTTTTESPNKMDDIVIQDDITTTVVRSSSYLGKFPLSLWFCNVSINFISRYPEAPVALCWRPTPSCSSPSSDFSSRSTVTMFSILCGEVRGQEKWNLNRNINTTNEHYNTNASEKRENWANIRV